MSGPKLRHLPYQAVGSDLLRLGPLTTGGVLDTCEELHTHRGGQLLEYELKITVLKPEEG